jgi:hypothetical protein
MKHISTFKSIFITSVLACSFLFMYQAIAQKNPSSSFKNYSFNGMNTSWVELMQDTSVNFYVVQSAFYNSKAYKNYKKAIKEESKNTTKKIKNDSEDEGIIEPVSIYKRWENFMAPRVYPTGVRPSQGIVADEFKKFTQAYPSLHHQQSQQQEFGTLVGA